MFRYVVDPTDLSIRTKTRALVSAPEGLILVEQAEDIDVREGVYSEKLGKVIRKTESRLAQEKAEAEKMALAAEAEKKQNIQNLLDLIRTVPDTDTRNTLQQLVQVLRIL